MYHTRADGGRVLMGKMAGLTSLDAFFPYSVTIHAGQSITWTMEDHTMELHAVTSLPLPPEDQGFIPQPQAGNQPPLLLGPIISASTPSGSTVHAGDTLNSGIMMMGKD